VLIELDVPADWRTFKMPKALDERLQSLLDRQENGDELLPAERREAKAIAELADMLTLMKLRARNAGRKN
jgi:hypothetical protein